MQLALHCSESVWCHFVDSKMVFQPFSVWLHYSSNLTSVLQGLIVDVKKAKPWPTRQNISLTAKVHFYNISWETVLPWCILTLFLLWMARLCLLGMFWCLQLGRHHFPHLRVTGWLSFPNGKNMFKLIETATPRLIHCVSGTNGLQNSLGFGCF